MAEVAKKEPSMEDILSSIRKIIAEEGSAEVQHSAPNETPAPAQEVAPIVHQPAEDSIPADVSSELRSTIEASPAPVQSVAPVVEPEPSIPEDIPMPAQQQASSMVSEMPVAPEMPSEAGGSDASLASIAANIQGMVQTTAAEDNVPEMEVEPVVHAETLAPEAVNMEMPEPIEPPVAQEMPVHVEMAEATPAPVIPEISEQDMAREEEAFRGALMSPSSDYAVTDSFDRLKRSAMDDIEAKTEAILRPMLREWLDEHLPTMVERLVREEIERVARGS